MAAQEPPSHNNEIQKLVRITGKASLNGFEFGSLGLLAAGPLGGLLGALVGATYGGVSSGVDGVEKPYVERRRAAAEAEARRSRGARSPMLPPRSEGLPRGPAPAPNRSSQPKPQGQQQQHRGRNSGSSDASRSSGRKRGRRGRGRKNTSSSSDAEGNVS